jgi:hypothetical protein
MIRSILLATALAVGTSLAAAAQAQYSPYPPVYPYPTSPTVYNYPFLPPVAVQPYVPTTPPAWSYDPYTSGIGPCPQRMPNDPPCKDMIEPTYGQPDYWSR